MGGGGSIHFPHYGWQTVSRETLLNRTLTTEEMQKLHPKSFFFGHFYYCSGRQNFFGTSTTYLNFEKNFEKLPTSFFWKIFNNFSEKSVKKKFFKFFTPKIFEKIEVGNF